MKTVPYLFVSALAATLLLAFADHAVMAQEKAKTEKGKAAPAQEKIAQPGNVLFENERVRVVEVRTKPGEKFPMQERPDRVIYHFNSGKQRVHYSDGKTEEREFKAGSVDFFKRDTTSPENIGKTEIHNLNVSLK